MEVLYDLKMYIGNMKNAYTPRDGDAPQKWGMP